MADVGNGAVVSKGILRCAQDDNTQAILNYLERESHEPILNQAATVSTLRKVVYSTLKYSILGVSRRNGRNMSSTLG